MSSSIRPATRSSRVELTDDGPVIAIELSESRTLVSTAADTVEAAGVELATWVHVEVRWDDGGMAWEVTQEAALPGHLCTAGRPARPKDSRRSVSG